MSIATASPPATTIPIDWTEHHGPGEGLKGLSGSVRLMADGLQVGILNVADGAAKISPDGAADATLHADTLTTLIGLLGGEVQPVVARLQNRLRVDGDVGLVIRIFFGLRAGSPWSGILARS